MAVSSAVLLAVDGGNTKTDALIIDSRGTVLGHGRSGNSDLYARAGEAAAVTQFWAAVDAALTRSGRDAGEISGIALRLAGVDWPEDHDRWRAEVTGRRGFVCAVSIANDGCAGIRTGRLDGIGVAVTGGTSSAIGARGRDGRLWSLDMWSQHPMGAMGLGIEGYRAATLAELGMAPATSLQTVLPAVWGLPTMRDLVHRATFRRTEFDGRDFALAAPAVTAAALAGDDVAREITAEQGKRFAAYAAVAARAVGLDDAESFGVVLGGSVLRAPGSPVVAALRPALADVLPTAEVTVSTLPPVVGAALDALADSGITVTDEHRARLAEGVAHL